MKRTAISLILFLSSLLCFFSVLEIRAEPTETLQITPEINWGVKTFNFNIFNEWDHESYILNYTGSYDEVYNYTYEYIIPPSDYWYVENRTVFYQSDYSYFSNATYTGNFSISVSLTAYTVEVNYGSGLYLLWMAAKDGTLEIEYYLDEVRYYRNFSNTYYKRTDIEGMIYNVTTGEPMGLIFNYTDYEDSGTWSYFNNGSHLEGLKTHKNTNYNFTLPLILTYQVFTTENDERVAWAEMMVMMIIFDDIDKNGFYSVGEQSIPNEFSMMESYEFQGLLSPLAIEVFSQRDSQWEGGNSSSTFECNFPSDKSISELADSIQFTPPTLSGNETLYTVEWDIHYPEYPTDFYLPGKSFYMGDNALYENTSPANYSYGYDYSLENERSDLDLTLDFPKVTNETAYEAVEGLSLSLPHYNFFLSSDAIEERVLNVLTVPSSIFNFEINGTDVAEVNMEQDKRFYTVYDYPEGKTTTTEALGSSVTKLVTDSIGEQGLMTPKNVFLDLIYSVKDLDVVKTDSKLANPFDYFTIEMTNYPLWSGERFVHDPTFSTFFTTAPIEPSTPVIPGYNVIALLGICFVITFFIIIKRNN